MPVNSPNFVVLRLLLSASTLPGPPPVYLCFSPPPPPSLALRLGCDCNFEERDRYLASSAISRESGTPSGPGARFTRLARARGKSVVAVMYRMLRYGITGLFN